MLNLSGGKMVANPGHEDLLKGVESLNSAEKGISQFLDV